MPIIKYDPFRDLGKFFEDDFFGFVPAVRRTMEPSMDMYQTLNDVVVEMQVPKIEPKDLKVTVEDGVLKVEGGSVEQKEEKDREYFRREIYRGHFSRMLTLPMNVKESETKASFEHGVLKITMPKADSVKPKTIEVEIK